MVKRDRKCGTEGRKRGTKKTTKATGGDKLVQTRGQTIIPCVPSMYPCVPSMYPSVPTMSLQAAVMDLDPHSEGLYSQDPPRPPCVPVSPRPRDKAVSGVLKRGNVPVFCPVPPSGPPGGIPQLEVLLRQMHSLQKGECENPCGPPYSHVPHVLLCSLMCLPHPPVSHASFCPSHRVPQSVRPRHRSW